jgi:hypothetical protein
MATVRVGGEVDALCTRCKLTLAHTVLAMVGEKIARVQCNTCGGAHAYRGAPSASGATSKTRSAGASSTATRASRASATAEARVTVSFEQRLAGRDLAGARRYNVRDAYALDEVIEHPTFGYGIVTAVRSDKIDVVFKIFEKTLIHGRGGAPAARPAFQPPRSSMGGPSDKPMAESSPAPAEEGGEDELEA